MFLFSFISENEGRFRGISASLINDFDFGTQLAKAGVVFLWGVGVIKTSFGEILLSITN